MKNSEEEAIFNASEKKKKNVDYKIRYIIVEWSYVRELRFSYY